MQLSRALAAAALAAAAAAAPAHAADGGKTGTIVEQDYVYTVSTSATYTLLGRLDATCTFRPDRWSMDSTPTSVTGVVTTTGGAGWIRCEVFSYGWQVGDNTFYGSGPVFIGEGLAGSVGYRPDVRICVSAGATLAGTDVDTQRVCRLA